MGCPIQNHETSYSKWRIAMEKSTYHIYLLSSVAPVKAHTHIGTLIIVVIIMWSREKPSEKENSDITVIWVCDWFKWANLFKISSLMSQFLTNQRALSLFCCFLFAVFNNSRLTAPGF